MLLESSTSTGGRFVWGILAFLLLLDPQGSRACTAFRTPDSQARITAKSYDWVFGHGLVYLNPRNTKKRSLPLKRTDKPVEWTARFGSLTFNQFGAEFPVGGMNEKGLVVEALVLSNDTRYSSPDRRGTVNELQWVQYQLDNSETIEDMVRAAGKIRLSSAAEPLHYFACDLTKCGTFEFIGGKLVVHAGSDLPVPSLANTSYDKALRHIRKFQGFGGDRDIPEDHASLSRFARASQLAKAACGRRSGTRARASSASQSKVMKVFNILRSVSIPSMGQWHILYDQAKLRVYFATRKDFNEISYLDLKGHDFSCSSPARFVELEEVREGSVTSELRDFSASENRRSIERSISRMAGIPRKLAKLLADYPAKVTCIESGSVADGN